MRALDYAVTTRTCFNRVTEAEMEMYKAGMYLEHHSALVTGYTKKRTEELASYNGRFGKGVAVFTNFTTRYSRVYYYVGV